ncbi:MAG TPA: beta-L-arabinofuranosidase domain-containing protein [Bryobacteraceae bacterium]|nr:beta-L-arabinofuranosidase domain-containing protein [Bryobacteraceae bacterium]
MRLLFLTASLAFAQNASYPVKPVPFTAVHFHDDFWAPRIEINRTATIPSAFVQLERAGDFDNFDRAAAVLRGDKSVDKRIPKNPYDDSDVFKVIEGASYALLSHPDPQLDAFLDRLIARIAAAQEPDGYLYTARTIDPLHPHVWAGPERWMLDRELSHELYNLGHLYEAAMAHYQATGKRTLLEIALRSADLLDRTFGPGKMTIWPGHQVAEIGLAKMYLTTGNQHYLALAKFLLDSRGPDGMPGSGREYNQSHMHVVDQTEAVGHAVRATYMYSGMADVAALTGDQEYVRALDKIWENVAGKKLYITGGIGATNAGEAFGKNYELPNMTAYNETCAAVGNDFWNHRLFLLHADSKYIDVLERTLYNGAISGVSLDGKTFFYPNPLESNGQHARSPWFGTACCPSNITRFVASMPGYVYAQSGDQLYVNLFVANNADVKLDSGVTLNITQETEYPWEGAVRMTVRPDHPAKFTVKIRIPGWARNQPVPSDLYRYTDGASPAPTIVVNGKPVATALDKGYAIIAREWKAGDTIDLKLPMPVRRVIANDEVAADRGRVALERGPILYAVEWPDVPGGKVRNLVVPRNERLTAEFKPALLKGVEVIQGRATALSYDAQGKLLKSPQPFTAIPYYAWANRGRGQMIVWLPETEAAAKPAPFLTPKVTSSPSRRSPLSVNDGDESTSFDWWPKKGTTEWVEYAFDKPATVSSAEVYWFDDTGDGEVRMPASWRILYRDGDAWKPVDSASSYGVEKDKYNKVTFKAVSTGGLRLEVTMQPNWSAGLMEWKVK